MVLIHVAPPTEDVGVLELHCVNHCEVLYLEASDGQAIPLCWKTNVCPTWLWYWVSLVLTRRGLPMASGSPRQHSDVNCTQTDVRNIPLNMELAIRPQG